MENECGNLFYQEFQFAPVSFPLKLSARVTLFDTKSFNSVIYAYEKDLLYTFSIPAFYGKGWRTYFNLKYKISKNAEVWFKLGNTYYNNRETISSGYNEISGNQKTELKFQFRLKI